MRNRSLCFGVCLFLLVILGQVNGQIVLTKSVQIQTDSNSFLAADWNNNNLFVSNSSSLNTVDGGSLGIINTTPLMAPPNAMCFDPTSGSVGLTSTSVSGNVVTKSLTILNPATGSLQSLNPPELPAMGSCAFSQDGSLLYISADSITAKSVSTELAAISTSSWKTIQTWSSSSALTNLVIAGGNVYGTLMGLGQSLPSAVVVAQSDGSFFSVQFDPGFTIWKISGAGQNGLVYVAGLQKAANGTSVQAMEVIDPSTNKVVRELTDAPFYLAWPSNDPWFAYEAYNPSFTQGGINALSVFAGGQLFNSADNDQVNNIGLAANRQPDGSDIIIALRDNGSLDKFTANQPPTIYSVTNGANFEAGAVVSGEIISIFGFKLSAQNAGANNIPLPTSLGGTQVLVGGFNAPLYYVSPGQINAQVPGPFPSAATKAGFQVTVGGVTSNTAEVPLAATAPGLFNDNGSVATDPIVGGWTSLIKLAAAGEDAVFYATGLGATSPLVPAGVGSPVKPLARSNIMPTVVICKQTVAVDFAGLTPGEVGLFQINAPVPQNACDPNIPDVDQVKIAVE